MVTSIAGISGQTSATESRFFLFPLDVTVVVVEDVVVEAGAPLII